VDPVTLGLATQLELDAVVRKAADKKAKEDARRGGDGPTLMPASETGVYEEDAPEEDAADAVENGAVEDDAFEDHDHADD